MATATEGANGAAPHVAAAKFGWANIQEIGGRKRTTDAPIEP
jgi:hypothetical protein